jgi:uncharacterized protein (DUF952 family)
MQHKIIYHIVTTTDWDLQKSNATYTAASLAMEGFIHCSTREQLDATIQRYYAQEKAVIVLHIDTTKLLPELKYELAPSVNQLFPHLFGELNREAVVEVELVTL